MFTHGADLDGSVIFVQSLGLVMNNKEGNHEKRFPFLLYAMALFSYAG